MKTVDIPVGEFKWLTVVSPNGPDDIELVLEPNSNPAVPAKVYQRALFESGIPGISFGVDDIHKEYARLTALGVVFTMELTVPPCLMTLRQPYPAPADRLMNATDGGAPSLRVGRGFVWDRGERSHGKSVDVADIGTQ